MHHYTYHNIENSVQLSNRRRELFPTKAFENTVLDFITPLDLLLDSEGETRTHSLNKITNESSLGDYDIIGVVDEIPKKPHCNNTIQTPISTKIQETNTLESSRVFSSPSLGDDGNGKISQSTPNQYLKTPHELSGNSQVPRLIRKGSLDYLLSNHPLQIPQIGGTGNHSKVRTILFPEIDMSLPTQTFYPKPSIFFPKCIPRLETLTKVSKEKSKIHSNTNTKRSRFGRINAGVCHGIKKRRRKQSLNNISTIKSSTFKRLKIEQTSEMERKIDMVNLISNNSHKRSDDKESLRPSPSFKSSNTQRTVSLYDKPSFETDDSNNGGLKRPKSHCLDSGLNGKRQRLTYFEIDDPFEAPKHIENLIDCLENDENRDESVSDEGGSVLMSPTSQMCNMTSSLVLSSPKKAVNLTEALEKIRPTRNEPKLFPVFYPIASRCVSDNRKSLKDDNKIHLKKFKSVAKEQMLLDAGQKRWGLTQCVECEFVYHSGDPTDELQHLNHHNKAQLVRFKGWKNERIVFNEDFEGRILQIVPGDPQSWWRRIKEILKIINRNLGFYELFDIDNTQAFIYVKNCLIVGAIIAESKESAHKLQTNEGHQIDFCSQEAYPVKCGVSRIWVLHNYRKRGIGTALMDSLKRNFVFGRILRNDEIALSSPTEDGKKFGQKYFKTPNFLIYI